MTLTEAAAVLGVRPDTLRQQIHNGRLVATKVGRDWTVTGAEVARYAKESAMGPHLDSVEGLEFEVDPSISEEVAALRAELESVTMSWHRDAHTGDMVDCDLCRPALDLLS